MWLQKYHPEDTVVCKALFEEELNRPDESSAVKIGREKPKAIGDDHGKGSTSKEGPKTLDGAHGDSGSKVRI